MHGGLRRLPRAADRRLAASDTGSHNRGGGFSGYPATIRLPLLRFYRGLRLPPAVHAAGLRTGTGCRGWPSVDGKGVRLIDRLPASSSSASASN